MKPKIMLAGIIIVLLGLLFLFDYTVWTPKDFQYEIGTCEATRGFKNNSIILEVSNDSVTFHQTLNTYCNTNKDNLKLEYIRRGNNIQVNEIFSSESVAKCICPFEIVGMIPDLEKGSYKITFTFINKYTNQKDVLGVLEIDAR